MCGIVGYIGNKQAAPVLVGMLQSIEYRGYDSVGMALASNKVISVYKNKGYVSEFINQLPPLETIVGNCGIGHTRWATHGRVSVENAHPQTSLNGLVTIVHNGIIENYKEIKNRLHRQEYKFSSQTDTEVLADLIEFYYTKTHDAREAIISATNIIRGAYAFAAIFSDIDDQIFMTKKELPIVIGIDDSNGKYLSSDIFSLPIEVKAVCRLDDNDVVTLTLGSIKSYNKKDKDKTICLKSYTPLPRVLDKQGCEYFLVKEICEQPTIIRNLLKKYVHGNDICMELDIAFIRKVSNIIIVACGSSYNVGCILHYIFQDLVKLSVNIEHSSEFLYANSIYDKNSLAIIISQSGETLDSILALRKCNQLGISTLAIVNNMDSTIAKEAKYAFDVQAGPEFSVATTKAYNAQLVVGYLLALRFSLVRETVSHKRYIQLINSINCIPSKIDFILAHQEKIRQFAYKIAKQNQVILTGRGLDSAICLEASLKIKEIDYIFAESIPAGEFKHGHLSLLHDGFVVLALITQANLKEKTLSNISEILNRGATVYVFSSEDTGLPAQYCCSIPKLESLFMASIAIVPFQLLAAYMGIFNGINIDKPKNLAKCVTTE